MILKITIHKDSASVSGRVVFDAKAEMPYAAAATIAGMASNALLDLETEIPDEIMQQAVIDAIMKWKGLRK